MFNELQKTIWGDWNTRFYIKFMHTLTDLCKTFATKLTLKTNALMQRGKYLLCKSEFNCELSEKNTREKEKENHNFLKMNRLDGECGQRCEFIVCKSLSALYIYIQRCGACIGRCVCVFVSFFRCCFLSRFSVLPQSPEIENVNVGPKRQQLLNQNPQLDTHFNGHYNKNVIL